MLYWLRWLYTMVVSFAQGGFKAVSRDVTAWSTLHFRCMPSDLDEFMHMNNGSYLPFMEMGRRNVFVRILLGLSRAEHKASLKTAVAAGHYIRYRMSIAPLQWFKVETRICGTRGRSVWFEQRFVDARGVVLAHCFNRTTLKDRDASVYQMFGFDQELALPRTAELFAEADESSRDALSRLSKKDD